MCPPGPNLAYAVVGAGSYLSPGVLPAKRDNSMLAAMPNSVTVCLSSDVEIRSVSQFFVTNREMPVINSLHVDMKKQVRPT